MASKYDIQAIQFLIASFNSIVKEVGKTDSSVRLFKRQSDGLCSLGKVSKNDVEFVYRLLGMKNTNSLKWEISLNRLKIFTDAMNYMICCKDESSRRECLEQLMNSEKIDDTVYKYISELYDIHKNSRRKPEDFKNSDYGKFGTMQGTSQSMRKTENSHNGCKEQRIIDNNIKRLQVDDINRNWLLGKREKYPNLQVGSLWSTLNDKYCRVAFGKLLIKKFLNNRLIKGGDFDNNAGKLIDLSATKPQDLFMTSEISGGPQILQAIADQIPGHLGDSDTQTKFNRVCYVAEQLLHGDFVNAVHLWQMSYQFVYHFSFYSGDIYISYRHVYCNLQELVENLDLLNRLIATDKPIQIGNMREGVFVDDEELSRLFMKYKNEFVFLMLQI